MAGAGYRLFNTGDVLTAQQVNEYLQQQVIMRFASSAARTSALSGVLAEGMASWLDDTNSFEIYNGTAWVSASGDLTGLTAGTGITITDPTGPVPTITSNVATTFDAKGDLVVGTGADTFSKLTVGNSGDTIVADSSTSTGLRYNPQNALTNPVINGGFDLWQRGTSFTYASGGIAYQADRWQGWGTGAASAFTVTRQTTGDTTNLPNIQYCLRMQRPSGNTNTDFWAVIQSMESVNSIPYAGKTVTLSFYARKGANFSSASSALTALLYSGTGTDQNLSNGFTGSATPINSTSTLTTTWQRFSYTGTISSTATQLGLNFNFQGSGTAGAADYFEVTGVQIDLGTYTASTAPSFRRTGGTIAGELAAASRYYYKVDSANASDTRMNTLTMTANSTTVAYGAYIFPVRMRTSPTFGSSTASGWSLGRVGIACTAMAQERASQYSSMVKATVASGLTAGNGDWLEAGNNNTAYIEFSAEL